MRDRIFDRLSKLDTPTVNKLLFKANIESAQIYGPNAPATDRIIAAINYLEGRGLLFVLDWLIAEELGAIDPITGAIGRALAPFTLGIVLDATEAMVVYRACLLRGGPDVIAFDPPSALERVLRTLVSHGQHNPLLEFAEWICEHKTEARAEVESQLAPIVPDWRNRLRKSGPRKTITSSKHIDPYAIVQIHPESSDEYTIRAWFVSSRAKPLLGPDRVARKDIPTLLATIHQKIKSLSEKNDQRISIDVFMPDDLFSAGFDKSPIKVPGLPAPVPIDNEYRLVLRWNDRAANPDFQFTLSNIRRRWALMHSRAALPEEIHNYDAGAACCVCALVECERWTANQIYEGVIRKDELVLCLLSAKPEGDVSLHALRGLLLSGVPAILWSHDPGPSKGDVAALIGKGRPEDLPERIWRARGQVQGASALSLLWENPDRQVPKDKPLRAAK